MDVPGTSRNYYLSQLPIATSSVSSEYLVKRYPNKEECKKYFKNYKKNKPCRTRRFVPRRLSNEGHYDYWLRMQKIQRGFQWYDYDDYDDFDIIGADLFALSDDLTGELTEYQKKLLKEKEKELEKKAEEEYFQKLRDMTTFQRLFLWLNFKFRKVGKTWLTHILLLLILTAYTLLGGLMFHHIEGNDDTLQERNPLEDRTLVIGNVTEMLKSKINSKSEVSEKLSESLTDYATSIRTIINENNANKRGLDEKNWGYWSSVFFCFTVYTTIGYGHMAPKTTTGRAVVILYSILGIPLFLIVMSDFGKSLTTTTKGIWALIRTIYYSKIFQKGRVKLQQKASEFANEDPDLVDTTLKEKPDDFQVDDTFSLPMPIAIALLLIYMFLGALLYNAWENFSFIEAYYFVFTSIATIGFGDFVPMNEQKLIACIIYLIIGLSITSMCVNVVRENLVISLITATSKVGMELDPQQMYAKKFEDTEGGEDEDEKTDEDEHKDNIQPKIDKRPPKEETKPKRKLEPQLFIKDDKKDKKDKTPKR